MSRRAGVGLLGLVAALTVTVVALASCRRTLRVPRPIGAARGAPPAQQPTAFAIDVDFDLAPIVATLETQVPTVIDQSEWENVPNTPVAVKYHVVREPFRVTVSGNSIHAETTLRFSTEACLRAQFGGVDLGCPRMGSCGITEPLRRVDVAFNVRIDVGADWTLAPHMVPELPRTTDPCRITVLQVDVMGYVTRRIGARLMESSPRVERRVREASQLRSRIEPLWALLQQPVALDRNAWLLVRPQRITATPLTGFGRRINTSIVIHAAPTVTIGPRPTIAVAPLPALLPEFTRRPGFTANIDVQIPLAEAELVLRPRIVGREFTTRGQTVRAESVRLAGRDGAFVATVGVRFVRGWFRGATATVTLAGLARYDARLGAIVVDSLDYTIDARSLFLRAADTLMQSRVRSEIASRLRLPLGGRVEQMRVRGERALNRAVGQHAQLQSALRTLAPSSVYVTQHDIIVRVTGAGEARVVSR